ncbi:MAG: hypothetical protein ACTSV2_13070 [Candidatus Thorarchaeota archaeon]
MTKGKKSKIYDTTPKGERYDTRKRIREISKLFDWPIISIRDEMLSKLLFDFTKTKVQWIKPSPILDNILTKIEKESSTKTDMKWFFVSNSIKYCYLAIRSTAPNIKAFEKVVLGIKTKDIKLLATGIVESQTGELSLSFLLRIYETVKYRL